MNLSAVDRTKPQKLYFQILEMLKGHIENNDWKVGTRIPTEEQLCIQYNVSRATVRFAVGELVSLGYLKKIHGKGTFVRRKQPEQSITMLLEINDEGVYRDLSCITRVIEDKIMRPADDIKGCLTLSDDDYCYFVSRMIIAEGAPVLMQKLYLPCSLLPDYINVEKIKNRSLYSFLEAFCGMKIQRLKEIIDLSAIDEKDAAFLGLTAGAPVLRARHICYAHGDAPLSFSCSFYRTEIHARTLELERMRI